MTNLIQKGLLVIAVVTALVLVAAIYFSITATTHGPTPARQAEVQAGPYPMTVSLYTVPANAGYAMPFAIAPSNAAQTAGLTYEVVSVPGSGVHATPVKASLSPDPQVKGGIQGEAEITVAGPWSLQITVKGPNGPGGAEVPLTATTLPAVPVWLGWMVGLLPLAGLIIFLLFQARRPKPQPIAVN